MLIVAGIIYSPATTEQFEPLDLPNVSVIYLHVWEQRSPILNKILKIMLLRQ